MAEGLTITQEAFRLGLAGDDEGPYYGRRRPDTVAAWLAGRFVRCVVGGVDPLDDEYDPELIMLDIDKDDDRG